MSSSKKNAAGCGNIRKKVVKRNGKEYPYGHVTEQMKTESANRMEAFIQSVSA